MKILVCLSKSPDTTSKINFTDNNTKFDETDVQFIINPYDEWYALVRGIELKEANGGSVTTITVGTAQDDPIIRKGLAIGADSAIRIDAEPKNAFFVAKQIAEYAKNESFDLVLLGKETINYNGAQVGGMVAELLNLPYVSLASKLDINGTVCSVTRDAKGGDEIVEVNLPVTISASKGMAEQRIPNMRGIMAARSKPLTVVASAEVVETTTTVSFDLPPAKTGCKYIDPNNMDELADLLHNEAKVI